MNNVAVKLMQVSKYYKLYDSPKDRFKEALDPFRRRRYREFFALNNINIDIKKGEILGIVGRNGSGKSTLLKLIAGVIPASSGHLIINGNVSAMLELGSGMNPDLTGIQNIHFGGIMLGFSQEEMKAKVDDIVAFADIGKFINQPLKTYSSGMKARLGFALAVSVKPDILVVDEVLAVGDDLFKRKCFAKMQELFNSGCTVLFVSHSIPNVIEICTRAILLDKGEIILEGPTSFVTRYYQKLLYALPASQNEIREEIKRLDKNQHDKERYNIRVEQAKNETNNKSDDMPPVPASVSPEEDLSKPKAYFIPDFTPQTTVAHEFYDVKVFDIQVHALTGKVVNALVMGETYTLSYKVQINLDAYKVKFSTLILSEKGLAISGVSMAESTKVQNGDIFRIQIRFNCMLLPGTYFISISVNNVDKNNEMVRLCDIHDAIAFKVQKEKNQHLWGIVGLDQTGQIDKIKGV